MKMEVSSVSKVISRKNKFAEQDTFHLRQAKSFVTTQITNQKRLLENLKRISGPRKTFLVEGKKSFPYTHSFY